MTYMKQLKGWRMRCDIGKAMEGLKSCDVDEVMERLENEQSSEMKYL